MTRLKSAIVRTETQDGVWSSRTCLVDVQETWPSVLQDVPYEEIERRLKDQGYRLESSITETDVTVEWWVTVPEVVDRR